MPQLLKNAPVCLVALTLVLCSGTVGLARNPWEIKHPTNSPPVDPRFLPGGSLSGYVPSYTPDFWKGQISSRIQAGTVLTAILEDDLSSAKNKKGDTFTLSLDDGFIVNGVPLIPPKSKILGSVLSATPAKALRNGNPGRLEVSLQALVFPDGSHMPIYAFVDSNPNMAMKKKSSEHHLGTSISDYGQTLTAMAFSFVSGPGFMMNMRNRGLDFNIAKGEAIPIRLTRTLDLPQQTNQRLAQPPGLPYMGGDSSRTPYPTGMTGAAPNFVDPHGPPVMPPPIARQNYTQNVAAGNAPGVAVPPKPSDPNSIFSQPIKPQTLNDMPDPF